MTIKVLHKKKDRSDCNNYRGIACPLGQSIAENGRVPPQQLLRGQGDTPRRAVRFSLSTFDKSACCSSCADCKNSDERGKSPCTCMCFIDLQKAYDSVDRELLWVVLAHFGVPEKMSTVIRQFHEGMRARVRTDDGRRFVFMVTCNEW